MARWVSLAQGVFTSTSDRWENQRIGDYSSTNRWIITNPRTSLAGVEITSPEYFISFTGGNIHTSSDTRLAITGPADQKIFTFIKSSSTTIRANVEAVIETSLSSITNMAMTDTVLCAVDGNTGAGEIWERSGLQWTKQIAFNLSNNLGTFSPIDVTDNFVAVGDPNYDVFDTNAGRVVIYQKTAGVWSLRESVGMGTPVAGGALGYAVGLAEFDTNKYRLAASHSSGVTTFRSDGDGYLEEASLASGGTTPTVALSEFVLAYHANQNDESTLVYSRAGNIYTLRETITSENAPAAIGEYLALDGYKLALSDKNKSDISDSYGTAIWTGTPTAWTYQANYEASDGDTDYGVRVSFFDADEHIAVARSGGILLLEID